MEMDLEWGKGLAQRREAEARKEQRWGDPMANPIKKKRNDELVLPDMGDDEGMKLSGFIVPQEIPDHSWLKRGLQVAPNRYGIKPGRHWDGVDRSTGFDKALVERMNDKHATEREAYLWSVSEF